VTFATSGGDVVDVVSFVLELGCEQEREIMEHAVPQDVRNPRPVNWIDRSIRQFNMAWYVGVVCALYAVAASALALAALPTVALLLAVQQWCADSAGWVRALALSAVVGAGFFLSGLTLLVVVPLYNSILPTRIRPFRGGYFTIAAIPWYVHNALLYVVRYTILPFVTFTPFGIWFLRAMGMKIGRRAMINTEFISDACLLTVGDDVVIGGSVRIFAHYGGGGHLTIAPVIIGDGATIGENATVMGDVIVGAGAVVAPHSVLLPGTRIAPGRHWRAESQPVG
jgi:hypothetical protein